MTSGGQARGNRRLRVIVGPTGAGKSTLAMQLAEEAGASIISADSRQVYRGFDIGTAKPSLADRARVPHYGIDVVEPTARFSAAQWADEVMNWLQEIESSQRQPLIVGGTGFYIRALVAPFVDAPPLDPERRHALYVELATRSTAELRSWCAALDPARMHLGRTQLLRAIETALLSGVRLSELHRAARRAPGLTARYLLVDPGVRLAAYIERRVREMLNAGWSTEVTRLSGVVPADAPAWSATGYDVLRGVDRGEISVDEAIHRIIVATRQYAKRQRTWFRHQLDVVSVTKVDPTQADAMSIARSWWHGEDA